MQVHSSGLCIYFPIGVYTAQCTIGIRWFPFDDQFCTLDFESWSYDQAKVNISLMRDSVDLKWYSNSTEWTLLGKRTSLSLIETKIK